MEQHTLHLPNDTTIEISERYKLPVQKLSWTIRRAISGKRRGENGVHITPQAQMRSSPLANGFVVAITEEVISQRRRMQQRLQHGIHKTRIAEVVEPPQPRGQLLVPGSERSRALLQTKLLASGRHPRLVINASPPLARFPFSFSILHLISVLSILPILPILSILPMAPIAFASTTVAAPDDGAIEVQIVDLIATKATEELRAFNVDG